MEQRTEVFVCVVRSDQRHSDFGGPAVSSSSFGPRPELLTLQLVNILHIFGNRNKVSFAH